MNRLSLRIVAVAMAVLFLGAASADARTKKPKKAYDLNANPLAGVQSKQPDKELYDKAMVAMKERPLRRRPPRPADPAETPIPSRNTACAPSFPSAIPGSRKAGRLR